MEELFALQNNCNISSESSVESFYPNDLYLVKAQYVLLYLFFLLVT